MLILSQNDVISYKIIYLTNGAPYCYTTSGYAGKSSVTRLQHLEAGRLGASTPQHVGSRPAVPDLCIASSGLLSVIDPLPMDILSRHTVAEIRAWPAADRHDLLAVANRDVRVARQNIAEMLLYVDDHAAHLAYCASADDDGLTLMSAELLPRLEGGIRAALKEADSL